MSTQKEYLKSHKILINSLHGGLSHFFDKKIFFYSGFAVFYDNCGTMMEYQQAARMATLQCFISNLDERDETCADISSDAKQFILYFKKGKCLCIMFRLSYFTIVCNTNEYKMMGQGSSLGQLYDVHNKIKISRKHWLGLPIYYDTFRIVKRVL